jgi:hypothetical protein
MTSKRKGAGIAREEEFIRTIALDEFGQEIGDGNNGSVLELHRKLEAKSFRDKPSVDGLRIFMAKLLQTVGPSITE